MTLCNIEANGVTPIPAPIITAWLTLKILEDGDPYGPSTKTYKFFLKNKDKIFLVMSMKYKITKFNKQEY